MKRKNVLSGILISFFVGLVGSSCKEENHADVVELKVLNRNSPIEVELTDLVDSVQYTVLETSDSCLLGEIVNVKGTDGYFFVRDNFGLYVFDDNGRFVNEISHKGNGHAEYVNLDNFYIDEARDLVGLICNVSEKIMFFCYDGTYHSTVRMKEEDSGMSSIISCPGQGLLVHYPMPNDFNDVSFEYKKARIHGDRLETQPLIPMRDFSTKDVYYSYFSSPIAVYRDTCFLLSVLSHKLYACKNGEIERIYQFDLLKELPSEKEQDGYKDGNFYDLKAEIKASGKSIGLTGIQANDDYVFVSVNDENMLIWDGEQSILIRNVYDSEHNHYFSNMVLSGGCAADNVGFYNADLLCQWKEKPLLRDERLSQIVDSIKENDNPVLYQFVFKTDLVNYLKEKYELQ